MPPEFTDQICDLREGTLLGSVYRIPQICAFLNMDPPGVKIRDTGRWTGEGEVEESGAC